MSTCLFTKSGIALKPVLLILLIWYLAADLFAQRPPDSLFQKVVIFKRPANGYAVDSSLKSYYQFAKWPQATGFYISPGRPGKLYVATAKHVFLTNDTVKAIAIAWETLLDKDPFWSSRLYHPKSVGLYPEDAFIDLVLADDCFSSEIAGKGFRKVHGFRPGEIVTREEFLSVQPNQELFYIGMNPDSISSEFNDYCFPSGRIKEVYSSPSIVTDSNNGFTFSYDFTLNIIGKRGISGSPIFIKAGDRYKLFGIVNGFKTNWSQSTESIEVLCTAAYRILDILKSNALY